MSDLGVQEGITAPLFSYGLIISGILALVFASGLFTILRSQILGKVGAFVFLLATAALVAIGIFPENIKPMHYYASVAFFALFPVAMLFLVVAFLQMHKAKSGLFTLAVALTAASPWAVQFAIEYVPNVAIPETISALSASTWATILGFNMLKQASHPRT